MDKVEEDNAHLSVTMAGVGLSFFYHFCLILEIANEKEIEKELKKDIKKCFTIKAFS